MALTCLKNSETGNASAKDTLIPQVNFDQICLLNIVRSRTWVQS